MGKRFSSVDILSYNAGHDGAVAHLRNGYLVLFRRSVALASAITTLHRVVGKGAMLMGQEEKGTTGANERRPGGRR